MKVLVFGNVGSGKTTLLNKLKEIFDWQVVAIDDYRRMYGDGSKEKELIAQKYFFEAIIYNKNQFIECIGIGKVSEKLFLLISENDENILCVKLVTPKKICKSRLKKRIWDIPFPENLDKLYPLIDRTDYRFNEGAVEALWGNRKHTTIISEYNQSTEDIDKIVKDVVKYIRNFN